MTLMSLTAYGATHQVTRQAAKKWADAGYLVMIDGRVDAEPSEERMRAAGKGRYRLKGHGGRRTAGVRGGIDRPGFATAEREKDEESYPDLVRARTASPIGCAAEIEALALATPLDKEALLEELDTLAWCDFETERQMAEWYRWPPRVSRGLADELGIPDKAQAVEAALRSLIVARLEKELDIDPEVYLAEVETV